MANYTGTNGNDSYWGGSDADRIEGHGGQDYLNGNGGNDEIFGGDGNDTLNGGEGDDIIEGGLGNDILQGEVGVDILRGQGGDDRLYLSSSNSGGIVGDSIDGGDGVDTLLFGGLSVMAPIVFSIADPAVAQNLAGATIVNVERLSFTGGYGNDDITGGALDDYIDGFDGNDRIDGGLGNDTLDGGVGTDTIYGGGGNDAIYGGADNMLYGGDGDDTFRWAGDALIDGGAGNDRLSAEYRYYGDIYPGITVDLSNPNVETMVLGTRVTGIERLWFDGGFGVDRLTGGSGDDSLTGNGGDDILIGGTGNDSLSGGDGNDQLSGGAGDDVLSNYTSDSNPADIFDGGDGFDLLELHLRESTASITIDLLAATAMVANIEQISFSYWSGTGIINVSGGAARDYIYGGSSGDVINGRGGDDDLRGEGGDDVIDGGAGNDFITGDSGTDWLEGGDGDDFVRGNGHIDGEAGDDQLFGGQGADMLIGGDGMDALVGNGGGDTLDGGSGADRFVYYSLADSTSDAMDHIQHFESGQDKIDLTWLGNVRLSWIQATDPATGSTYSLVTIRAGAETATLRVDSALTRADFLADTAVVGGTSGDDVLEGTDEADEIFGQGGNDLIYGRAANDLIEGGDGNDRLSGDGGDDTLKGDGGDDFLIGGAGKDDYSGGDGIDTLDFSGEAGSVTVNLSSNSGLFSNSPLATRPLNPGEAFDSFGNYEAVSGIENLILTAGDDFVLGSDSANRFEAGAGDDILLGEGGNDLLLGAEGFDFLSGGLGDDRIEGGGGDDEIEGGGGDDRLDGGSGSDTAIYTQAAAGVTVTLGLPGDAQNTGGAGVDTLFDIENLTGSKFADILIGNDLPNVLHGAGGGDTMRGGHGDDTYFVVNAGDSIEELAGQGVDTVRTYLTVYSLVGLANVENLGAAGPTASRDFRGNAANNVITGGSGNDILRLHDGGDDSVFGGAGNDTIFIIGSLTAADVVNGGSDTDTLVLQGPYGALTLTGNITQIENISILAGSNTNFGEPGTNRYDYVLTIDDANFAAGVQARINGAALLAGEDFTFDGSAETNANLVVYGGKGVDTLTGGLGNDIFYYAEERFATGDTVNGGAGYDGMFLRGNYTIDFNAPGYTGLFTNIENLTLTSATDERYARGGGTEFDYNLILSDAIVKPGETLTVSGALLMATETMILDASQEADGLLRLFGGRANDTLKGGANADLIHGNLGADSLTGNGGADSFRYQSVEESNSGSMDQILDFTPGTDSIDLSRVDANSGAAGDQAFAWIGSSAFSGSAGELRVYEQSGTWFVEGDTNGDSVADLVIALTLQGPTPLSAGDFLP